MEGMDLATDASTKSIYKIIKNLGIGILVMKRTKIVKLKLLS